MTEYVLPFTCKQAIKTLVILKYIALFGFPCLMVYSFAISPNWIKEITAVKVTDYFMFVTVLGTTLGWLSQGLWTFITLAEKGRLPHFKCKCESDDKTLKTDKESKN